MKIYFAGAIRGGREKVYDYEKMVERFEKNGCEVLTKHVANPNLSSSGEKISFNEIYERDIKWLNECDIFFADITVPSLGVGYEISYAEKIGKKLYAIYEKDTNVSGFIRGDQNIDFLPYENISEVLQKIDSICLNKAKSDIEDDNER